MENLENHLMSLIKALELDLLKEGVGGSVYNIIRSDSKLDINMKLIPGLLGLNIKDRIMFYGAGELTQKLLSMIKDDKYEIIGLLDSSPEKWGSSLTGYRIFSPKSIVELKPDAVIIGSVAYNEEINKSLQEIRCNSDMNFRIIDPFNHLADELAGILWIYLYGEGVKIE